MLLKLNDRLYLRKDNKQWVGFVMGKNVHTTTLSAFKQNHLFLFHRADKNMIGKLDQEQAKWFNTKMQLFELTMSKMKESYNSRTDYINVASLFVCSFSFFPSIYV